MATAKVYKSDGAQMPYTPGSAVAAGDVVVIGEIVAVAPRVIEASVLGSVTIEGVMTFPKATLSTSAIAQGVKVYWDASGEVITTTASTNKVAGVAHEAAAAADATVNVKLEPGSTT